jgi:polar amino acid transport system substrate-binding protein
MKNLKVIILSLILFVSFVIEGNAQKRLDEITKRGVLKVGMTGEQPPFNMESREGELMGYEVMLAELLAESMNIELELVKIPFSGLLPALQKGDVDLVMSGMTITMERNMKVAFIGPYTLAGKSIVTTSEEMAKIKKAEDMNKAELKISFLKGSTSEQYVQTVIPDATDLPCVNYDEAVDKLLKGEANILLADSPICAITILKNPNSNLVTLDKPFTLEPIGMALPADDPLLLNFLENYFNALVMAGILQELQTYWFENGSWLLKMK